MRTSIAAIAVVGLAFSAPAATASDNQYKDPFARHYHAGQRCNPHKHAPRGFRCKRVRGHWRLVKVKRHR
jgi:hypothetical protein